MAKAKAAKAAKAAKGRRSKAKRRNDSGPVLVDPAEVSNDAAPEAEAPEEASTEDAEATPVDSVEEEASSVEGTEQDPTESETEDAEPAAREEEDSEDTAQTTDEDFEPEDTTGYLKGLVEALLFVADRPLELKDLARAVRIDKKRCQELLDLLREDYKGRGVYLEDVSGGVAFRTNPVYAEQVRKFLAQRPVRLSRAQLETLAIVAYRQPITRPEVDEIRGVDCGPVLKGLLERDLIRVLGKKDEPGRPMLYGTSPQFLELFNLDTLSELPTLKEFTELSDDSRLVYENELGEDAPEGPVKLDDVLSPPEASEGEGAEPEAPEDGAEEQEGADDDSQSGDEDEDDADEDDEEEDDEEEDDTPSDDGDEDDEDEDEDDEDDEDGDEDDDDDD